MAGDDIMPLLDAMEDEDSQSDDGGSPLGGTDDNGEEEVPRIRDITFDTQLPAAHSYLGDDMEEVRGRTVHEDASLTELPLLTLPGVVLLPGQILPLHLFQPQIVAMIRHVVDKDKTFGLVNSRYMGRDYNTYTLADIGTTAEIYSFKTEEESGIVTVRVKAIGRQRFQIKEKRRSVDGNVMAKVLILSERVLPNMLEGATPSTWKHVCNACRTNQSGKDNLKIEYLDGQFVLRPKRRMPVNRFTGACLTWWPPWVYSQYDQECLMRQLKDELTSWNKTLTEDHMPSDPSEFSFWVAASLPIDDDMRLHLLKIDSPLQRFRCELNIMKKCNVLCCKECGQSIAHKRDVFSMALQGPMATYVNPHGFLHDTLTVYKAINLNHLGSPETANSWFPGYAWTIVQCRRCTSHMGWRFTAVKKLTPEKFWGICRGSLVPGMGNEEKTDSDLEPSV